MDDKTIIFYDNDISLTGILENLITFNDNLLFVNIQDLKEKKSVKLKFVENELLSISSFFNLFQNVKFIRKLLDKLIYSRTSQNKQNNYQILKKFKKFEVKQLTEYIDAEIYEKADKLSVKLFNEVKGQNFIKKRFVFNDINLFETNRLEFVEHYYHIFLNLLAIIRLIKIEQPKKIISLPSVEIDKLLIIKSVSKPKSIELNQILENKSSVTLFLQYWKSKIRIIIDYFWYWKIWKIFNRDLIDLKRFKIEKKKNLVFSHYKNHFPPLIQVLKQTQKSKNTVDIIYIPHKHLQFFKEIVRNENLSNIDIIPHFDVNYKTYRRKYKILKQLLIDVINPDSMNSLIFESIDISKLVKLSFLYLYDKLCNSLRYLENFVYVMKQVSPNIITLLSGCDAIDILETRLATKLHIPSLFFPHAFYSIRRDHDAFEQDYVVCGGQKDKDYFLSLGTDEKNLITLGLPLFDNLYKKFAKLENPSNIRNKIVEQFGINPEKKILLLVTTHDEDFVRERVFNSVIDLIKNHKDYFLITKIHPIEDPDFYQKLLQKHFVNNITIVKNIDLYDLILASDIIIGRSSGAQIEAIFLDKNVIDLSYEASAGRLLMEKFDAVIPVYNPNDLPLAVQKVLLNENVSNDLNAGRKKYIEYSLYKFDGKSSERIKDLIEKIINI